VLVAFNGSDQFGEELSFYYQQDRDLEIQGRKRREAATQNIKRPAPQETKSPPSSHGPAMAKSIDGTPRR
jgi:hypothetical protein